MKTQWSIVTSMLFQLLLIEATSLVEPEIGKCSGPMRQASNFNTCQMIHLKLLQNMKKTMVHPDLTFASLFLPNKTGSHFE
jgi:hypothetical protein